MRFQQGFALVLIPLLAESCACFVLGPSPVPTMARHQAGLHRFPPALRTTTRRTQPQPLDLVAGLDAGTELPNLDGFYFAGVFFVAVSAGLLQYQSYGGKVGLGNFLSTGPEDKNWETRQARAAMQSKAEMNDKAKGSFWASILPKLDFVEVYGQEDVAPTEPEENKVDEEAVKELEAKLMQAVERQDFLEAESLKAKLLELKGEDKAQE